MLSVSQSVSQNGGQDCALQDLVVLLAGKMAGLERMQVGMWRVWCWVHTFNSDRAVSSIRWVPRNNTSGQDNCASTETDRQADIMALHFMQAKRGWGVAPGGSDSAQPAAGAAPVQGSV